MGKRRAALVVALMVGFGALLAAGAEAAFVAHYEGQTSQTLSGKHKPSPSVAVDIDGSNHAVHFLGIAYACRGDWWIYKIHPSKRHGRIDRKGNFKILAARKFQMNWISGHVANHLITGSFSATRHGCNSRGTYEATLGGA